MGKTQQSSWLRRLCHIFIFFHLTRGSLLVYAENIGVWQELENRNRPISLGRDVIDTRQAARLFLPDGHKRGRVSRELGLGLTVASSSSMHTRSDITEGKKK